MNARIAALMLAATSLAAAAIFWKPAPVAAQSAPDPASPAFFTQKVEPILSTNCYRCHSGMNHRGGYSMVGRENMLKGGHDGAAIVPGHADQSMLIRLIEHAGHPADPKPMPPNGKLSDADIATITAWVQAGAPMPPTTAP